MILQSDEVSDTKRMPFSQQTQSVLNRAYTLAKQLGHSYVGTEHLLLSVLSHKQLTAAGVLGRCGWEAETVRSLLLAETGRGSARLPMVQGLSPHLRNALHQARKEAVMLRAAQIAPEHLLLALTREENCTASAILRQGGADLNCVFSDTLSAARRAASHTSDRREMTTRLLELYCDNMSEKTARMEPVIGREEEIASVIQVLCRKNKNNPALIGEPGVGKTAIVEGLAQRIASGCVPEQLRCKRLLSLNMASVLAGTKYRGEFEERIRDILAEIRRCGNIILFVDEMHTIVGAGSAEGAIDAANLLKPALGRSELQMIGATTLEEYRRHIEKDAALERRFRPVIVREPTRAEAKAILMGLRPGLEQHHRLRISEEAVEAAIELSCRYLTDRFLPDKALDLLDESAARVLLRQHAHGDGRLFEKKRQTLEQELEQAVALGAYERAATLRDKLQGLMRRQMGAVQALHGRVLDRADIADTVSVRTGIPAGKLTQNEREKILALEQALSQRVIGQERAVSAVARAVLRGRTGLRDGRRPMASMLFMGPSGVGKTELCKALADCVYGSRDALIRIDMTEYMEPASVTRLIGAPPGYIGHEEGGTLTERVRRRPYSVVLFDELEKAHRDVCGLLLQIMEDGILTDSVGRCVDFKNTMIVMTSNIGSGQSVKGGLGFLPEDAADRAQTLLRQYLSVEFLGRIDCIAQFGALNADALEKIAQQQLETLSHRAAEQGLTVSIDAGAAAFLARASRREDSGARSLRRRIQDTVEAALAERILRGEENVPLVLRPCGDKLVVEEGTALAE